MCAMVQSVPEHQEAPTDFAEYPECELRLSGVLRSSARKRGAKARWLGAESRSLGPSSAPLYLPEYLLCLLLAPLGSVLPPTGGAPAPAVRPLVWLARRLMER